LDSPIARFGPNTTYTNRVWGYVYDHTVYNLSEIGDTFHGMSPNGSIYLMQERQRCKDPSNVARIESVQSNSRTKGVG